MKSLKHAMSCNDQFQPDPKCDGYHTGTMSQIQVELHEPPDVNFSFAFPPLHSKGDQQATKTIHFYSRHKSGCQSDLRMGLLLRKRFLERCSHSTSWPKPVTPNEVLDKHQSINHEAPSKQPHGSTVCWWHYSCCSNPHIALLAW